ncbi:MAG TPA: hypothetical protein H9881_17415 [Candidatus Stackebrandtia excrementipullorum]|nr:hypothetical protein [Candidatus Stackebrandtia excrementipullorum]
MVAGFELGGDSDVLRTLADQQISHRNEFDRIISDVRSQTAQVLGNWEGGGWEQHDGSGRNFQDYAEMAQAAFQKMISATDDNASAVQQMAARMTSRFER